MPIFTKHNEKILFIHVPKTGGSFIEDAFTLSGYETLLLDRVKKEYCRISPQHYHSEILEQIIDFSSITASFMLVRHPVERMISEYSYQKPELDINKWIMQKHQEFMWNNCLDDNHFRPQVEYITHPMNLEVFKYEDGLDQVINRFTLKCPRNPVNVGSKKYKSIAIKEMSEISKELLYDWYHEDFVEFEYPNSSKKEMLTTES